MIKPRIEYGFVKSPMTKASPDGGLVYTMDIRCCDRAKLNRTSYSVPFFVLVDEIIPESS